MKFRSKKIFIFFLSFLLIFMITVTPFGACASDLTDAVGDTYVPDLAHNSLDYTSWMFNGFSGSDILQPFEVDANGILLTLDGNEYPFIFIEFTIIDFVVVNVESSGQNWFTTTNRFEYSDCSMLQFAEVYSDFRSDVISFFEQNMLLAAYPYPLTYSYNLIVDDGTVVFDSGYTNFQNVVFEPKRIPTSSGGVGTDPACYTLDNSNTLIKGYSLTDTYDYMTLIYNATPNTTRMRVQVFSPTGYLMETIDLLNYDEQNIKTYPSGCTFRFVSGGNSGDEETLHAANFRFYVDTNSISENIEASYNSGYHVGRNEGYDEGFNEGLDISANYQLGYDTGYNEGYIKGGDDVRPVAYQEGYNAGYNVGLGDGINSNEAYQNGYETGYSHGHHIGSSEAWGENILGSAFEKPIELINGFTLFSVGDVDVTLGGVVGCVIALTLFIVFLKMFAGG